MVSLCTNGTKTVDGILYNPNPISEFFIELRKYRYKNGTVKSLLCLPMGGVPNLHDILSERQMEEG